MARIVRLLVLAFITVAVLTLAVINRQSVPIYFDILSERTVTTAYEAPLYLVIFLSASVGVILGALAMWMGQSRWRRQARIRALEVQKLKKDLTLLEKQVASLKRKRTMGVPAFLQAERGLPN